MKEGTSYFEFMPQQWPPVTKNTLHRIERDGGVASVLSFPDGHLAVIIERGEPNNSRSEHHFQRINIQHAGIVKFAYSWSESRVSAAAGGTILAKLEESEGCVLDIKIKEIASYPTGQLSVSPEILERSSREDVLFLETLMDITSKLTSESRYELVRLSALLRQMLCDTPPLVQEVNRYRKVTLLFEVDDIHNLIPIPEHESLRTDWRTLYPDSQNRVKTVKLEQFLKLVTITHEGVDFSVGDVIDVVAHAFGGVHHGKLRKNNNKKLDAFEKEIFLNGTSMVLCSLVDIGRVTLKALLPLAAIITQANE